MSKIIPTYSCKVCSEITGFTDSNDASQCKEICGDGINLGYYECDDGNSNDGDGCSSECNYEGILMCISSRVTKMETCFHYMLPRFKVICFNKSESVSVKFSRPMLIDSSINLTSAFDFKFIKPNDKNHPCGCVVIGAKAMAQDSQGYANLVRYNVIPQCDLEEKDV
jgi:cysteine-rich repeat protein